MSKAAHPSIAVEYIDIVPSVQVIDCSFAVDLEGVYMTAMRLSVRRAKA